MFEKVIDRRFDGKTTLEQCRYVELYLLDMFVCVCEHLKLTYWLSCGTLLGAIRHNGFIPWDDDIDVGMPKTDYNIFIKEAPKYLPKGVILQTPISCPGAFAAFAKLRDCSSFFCEIETHVKLPSGIFLDIFPYDPWPLFKFKLFENFFTHGLSYTYRMEQYHRTKEHQYVVGVFLSFMIACSLRLCHSILSMWLLICRLFLRNGLRMRPEVGRSVALWPKDWIYPLLKHEFEGKMYNVPFAYEKCLAQNFGNWQELPPIDKRIWHASIISPCVPPEAPWAIPYESRK